MNEKKPLYQLPGEMGKRGFEDLECYHPDFDSLYRLICPSEQTLNGFMAYAHRQRAGFQDYGDERIGESQTDYDATLFDEESSYVMEIHALTCLRVYVSTHIPTPAVAP